MRNEQPMQQLPYITSGREELSLLINSLRQSGAPEQEIKGLLQELRHEIHRDEHDNLDNHPDN